MLINKLTIEGEPIMRNSYNYRKTWIKHNGEIPKDENGISYEIHHINGDPTDDRIENLMCVSIKEHFDIHHKKGEYKACELIAGRMNNPNLGREMSEEWKKKQSKIQKDKVLDGTHHLLGGEIQSASNKKRVENGTHNFLDKDWHSEKNKRLVQNGEHILLKRDDGSSIGGDNCRERIKNGTHHFQNSEKQKQLAMKAKLVCQKAVLRISLDGNEIKEYQSVSDILSENPDYKTTIYRKIANGKEYKGYIWKYK